MGTDTPQTSRDSGSSLDQAIAALRRDLLDIRTTMPRCGSCDNFLTVVAQAIMDLQRVDSPVGAGTVELFQRWLDEAEGKVRVCNNCEVCVPTGPHERFTAALAVARAAGEHGR